ncbi:ATP synthase F1 subunit epsilon [Candidatus Daviesbacteria bacterium]|nr:ATP synthase F1 subunit epsilon [Candidatus Daviesbacteria bacterium]
MSELVLKIVTPEEEVLSEEVDQVNVSTTQGELGILPHHASLMAKLIPGELKIKQGGKVSHFAIGTGFLQVENNVLTVMTDLAENAEEIDEKAVEAARKRAEEALEQKLGQEEYAETLAALEKSLAQLRVKRRHRIR